MYVYTNFANRVYLPGAVFSLVVYNGTGTPGDDTLVTPDMIGPAADNYPWSPVATLTSGLSGSPMRFPMQQGGVYQLIEVMPPAGHQAPFGQWRITQPTTLTPTRELSISPIGNVPALFRPTTNTAIYYVGNNVAIGLPLTGGSGSSVMTFAMAGAMVIGVALAIIGVLKVKKNLL